MTPSLAPDTPGNPFSTKFIRPGAIPFLFPNGTDAAILVRRMRATRWRGQIIGPHGSGKTSLLLALKPHLEAERRTVWYQPEPGSKKLRFSLASQFRFWEKELLVIIDGFGELPVPTQLAIVAVTKWKGNGLLITTHRRKFGLPILVTLRPKLETFSAVVNYITSRFPQDSLANISQQELNQIWLKHNGNIREALFDLFDRAISSK